MSDEQPQSVESIEVPSSKAPVGYPNLTHAGRGRGVGTPNRTTLLVKEAILSVYADLQASEGAETAHAHFLKWAKKHPTQFYWMLVKLLPKELKAEVATHSIGALVFKGIND